MKPIPKLIHSLIALSMLVCGQAFAADKKPPGIYILAGQSNMQGHGKISTFEHIGMDPGDEADARRILTAVKSGINFSVTVTGYAGHSYQLQRADTPAGAWVNIGLAQSGAGAALTLTDTGGATGTARLPGACGAVSLFAEAGCHSKGFYSAQGRSVYANNGDHANEARTNPSFAPMNGEA